jgi:hypothetical protein
MHFNFRKARSPDCRLGEVVRFHVTFVRNSQA